MRVVPLEHALLREPRSFALMHCGKLLKQLPAVVCVLTALDLLCLLTCSSTNLLPRLAHPPSASVVRQT